MAQQKIKRPSLHHPAPPPPEPLPPVIEEDRYAWTFWAAFGVLAAVMFFGLAVETPLSPIVRQAVEFVYDPVLAAIAAFTGLFRTKHVRMLIDLVVFSLFFHYLLPTMGLGTDQAAGTVTTAGVTGIAGYIARLMAFLLIGYCGGVIGKVARRFVK